MKAIGRSMLLAGGLVIVTFGLEATPAHAQGFGFGFSTPGAAFGFGGGGYGGYGGYGGLYPGYYGGYPYVAPPYVVAGALLVVPRPYVVPGPVGWPRGYYYGGVGRYPGYYGGGWHRGYGHYRR